MGNCGWEFPHGCVWVSVGTVFFNYELQITNYELWCGFAARNWREESFDDEDGEGKRGAGGGGCMGW